MSGVVRFPAVLAVAFALGMTSGYVVGSLFKLKSALARPSVPAAAQSVASAAPLKRLPGT